MDNSRMDPEAVFQSNASLAIRPALYRDAHIVGPRLRTADLREIRASIGRQGIDGLIWSLWHSDLAWTMDWEGLPIMVFGASEIAGANEGTGSIWMMSTPDVEDPKVRWPFLRNCRGIVNFIQEEFFPVLTNVVDCRNTLHIRWLQWMGFEFLREIPEYGHENRPYLHFYRSIV